MNRKLLTLIVLAALGTGVYMWWFSDSKVIHRQTESLIECFEKDSDDGRFGGVLATTNFKKLLHEKIYLEYKGANMPYASILRSNKMSKNILVQAHGGLVNSAGIVTITDKKIIVNEIQDDKVDVDLSFHIKTEELPANFDQKIECKLTLKKTDGDWKIFSAIIK